MAFTFTYQQVNKLLEVFTNDVQQSEAEMVPSVGVVSPITVKFGQDISNSLKTLLSLTNLPHTSPISAVPPWKLGVHLPWILQLKQTLQADEWKVADLEHRINHWPNYTVRMKATGEAETDEEVDLHFVHVKSGRSDAIPLMLLHGWPGSYHCPIVFYFFHRRFQGLSGTFTRSLNL